MPDIIEEQEPTHFDAEKYIDLVVADTSIFWCRCLLAGCLFGESVGFCRLPTSRAHLILVERQDDAGALRGSQCKRQFTGSPAEYYPADFEPYALVDDH